jgi:hypothetical protein
MTRRRSWQIKSKVGGKCLKYSAASRGGKGLYMETCHTDPVDCVTKRCFYSESLGDEEWYLADSGQLIASFVRGNGHQIPPAAAAAEPDQKVESTGLVRKLVQLQASNMDFHSSL